MYRGVEMSGWVIPTAISSAISTIIIYTNGPFINGVVEYENYKYIYNFLLIYFVLDNPVSWDYHVHHISNAMGITWCLWRGGMYYNFLGRILMYELSTPWLGLYMMTKNKWFVPIIVLTYFYYRIYNNLELFRYYKEVDSFILTVHITNTLLNFYWFSKIIRKCYIKLIQ